MRVGGSKTGRESGAAVVELAIVLPLLLIIVFGIIEFGFLWLQSHYIANAAREGARIAAKLPDLDTAASKKQIQDGVREYLKGLPFYGDIDDAGDYKLTSPKVDITVEPGPGEEKTLADFGAPSGLDPEPRAVRVTVRVQTDEVWKPVLWGLLARLPFIGEGEEPIQLNDLTQFAVFAREN